MFASVLIYIIMQLCWFLCVALFVLLFASRPQLTLKLKFLYVYRTEINITREPKIPTDGRDVWRYPHYCLVSKRSAAEAAAAAAVALHMENLSTGSEGFFGPLA
jgi:hypothetical protein